MVPFGEFLKPSLRPYTLRADEDGNLVGMRLYGGGPFHRELKPATKIAKKSHFVIRAGDIIYNKLFAWKGTFGIVPSKLDGMFASDKFPTYSLDRARVDASYLQWFFRYPPLWDQAKGMSTGSAALSKLTLNPPKFLFLEMPLPPLAEQRRIVARIEELVAKITEARALRQQAVAEAEALFKSLASAALSALVTDGTLVEILVDKPRNGWSPKCDNVESGVPVLTLSAVTGFRFNSSAFKRSSDPTNETAHYWLLPGDLLITRSNTPELVGHVAIYDGDPAPCIYPDLMMKLVVDQRRADSRFVWMWLQTRKARHHIQHYAKGTSPTMKKISQPVVMSIPFPVRCQIAEQRRIVAYLDGVQAKVDALKRLQAETGRELDALLPSILDRAFKGEL
jgi:type I restriction enzyme S subunit